MSTFKVTKVEFEPPIKGEPVEPFDGFVCIGMNDSGWHAGCDTDSRGDAHENMIHNANVGGFASDFHPATIQMFRVEPA